MRIGYGKCVPPAKDHVVIYFLEKGKSEKQALDFFELLSIRRWKNLRGETISNWKVHAWEYIWGLK